MCASLKSLKHKCLVGPQQTIKLKNDAIMNVVPSKEFLRMKVGRVECRARARFPQVWAPDRAILSRIVSKERHLSTENKSSTPRALPNQEVQSVWADGGGVPFYWLEEKTYQSYTKRHSFVPEKE